MIKFLETINEFVKKDKKRCEMAVKREALELLVARKRYLDYYGQTNK